MRMTELVRTFEMKASFEEIVNYISVPRSEWTDDTARIAIDILEIEIESEILPGGDFHKNRNKNTSYYRKRKTCKYNKEVYYE